ncbi:CaiB/BaiF CoA transferase family protein [Microbacterium allomyrinae]|uniref:CoA transferase n=1 Tax=Microbacterium allomyrinae TaxID=2830666 RepID=A0A9X1LW54_9MICO|nr:CoA transferase [Microbacterium allomyrinae]MCC2033190.1 CoA transferase [Microbacterium allomyrinae]
MSPRPLEGVRIIAIEQYGAGPWGTLHLADLGADVIKIEDPASDGDVGRYVPPYSVAEDSLFFESLNRNKSSLSLDLRTAAGREVFEELVRNCDAVYYNLRGDVPAAIRVTYDDLKHINPAIVCCSLSGFGMTGPRAKGAGYDYMLQGLAGWMDLTGEPGGPPTKTGLSLVDFTGGYVAALALMVGLFAARRDGIGMDCDVSLFDTAITMLNYSGAWHLNEGYEPARTRHSSHPSLVPFQNLEASDGWLVVACPKEKFWRLLADAIQHPELSEDPRFATFADRLVNKESLLEILEPIFRRKTAAEWLAILEDAGVPVAKINTVAEALDDPHTVARGLIVETEHHRFGSIRTLASPVRVGDPASLTYRAAPVRHADARRVLTELTAFDDDAIARFASEGAFGSVPDPVVAAYGAPAPSASHHQASE